ncbi:aspartyl protease family protein At5g10770-like [Hordeum vulgare subsp. vulgare]|uniref:aspartyl protease family protein At5g10770-like n=1 Tax=Hordeum vulgare subsp. vulgare TaxID=112509 RepID=UPI001D1A47F8|nr:aspartyl protease family protein At5g10770-like [Hordeum vulgare subsp. vulgare]
MASSIHCLLLCLLLLAPYLGSSYRTGSINGGMHVITRDSGNGLAVTHRLSPCSPSASGLGQSMPSVGDAFSRDAVRLRGLLDESADSPGLTIPSTGTPLVDLPDASEYHVVVGLGTPAQNLTVGFDTATIGATLLQCKPCAAGDPCDKVFDPSQSSSIYDIPCGRRWEGCPFSRCSTPGCTFSLTRNGAVVLNGSMEKDTLTVAPSVHVPGFRYLCMEMMSEVPTDGSSGVLDLSRDRYSLASQVVLSPDTVAFSYCLPRGAESQGFLSFGTTRPELAGRSVSYATLHRRAPRRNLYFLRLTGVSIDGLDLPIPAEALASDALVEVQTTFTYLKPKVYEYLRDLFRYAMSNYKVAPASGELDTCYDFTDMDAIGVPTITLSFEGGASLELGLEQMMYFSDPHNIFSVACLAFAPVPVYEPDVAVIGSLAQAYTEVVYDLRGGKVGFVSERC